MRSRLSSLLESGVESYARAALDLPDPPWPDARSRRRAGPTRSWSSRRRPSPPARFAFRPAPTRAAWRPFLGWAALVALPSIVSRDSRASVGSYRSTASVASAWSVGSVLSAGSALSVASLGSLASAGSILSIGSAGSILSVGSSGAILALGPISLLGERGERSGDAGAPGPDPAVVRRISGLLAVAAIACAPFARRAA